MLKRSVWRPIAVAVFSVLLFCAILFFLFVLKLNILITDYLLLVAAVITLFVYVAGLLLFFGIRRKRSPARRIRRIIGLALSAILIVCFIFGSVFLKRVDSTKSAVSTENDEVKPNLVGVYVKSDDPAQSLSDMKAYSFAVLSELGEEKYFAKYAIERINEELGVEVKTLSCAGIVDAAKALSNGEAQAMAVTKSFLPLLEDTESFSDYTAQFRLICEIEVPPETVPEETHSPSTAPEKTTPAPEVTPVPRVYGEDQPLIFYLSGMDKPGDEIVSGAHGDVNILMAINPKTKQILLVSTPRDFFVTNFALGGGDKLTHCALRGVSNSIAALNKLYDIEVDNYCRINFTGFEKLVEELGGITVENPVAFRTTPTNGNFYFEVGEVTLGGYEALCYAREREAFGDGDLARGRNQVRIITGIINKAKTNGASLLMNYNDILEALAGTFETDLSSSQISDLVKVALANLKDWEVKTYSAWGVSGKRTVASMGTEEVFIVWPNDKSVAFASKLFDTLLNDELITDELLNTAPRQY